MLFGLYRDVNLCHHVVTRRRISYTRSKDDTIFIKSFQMYIVSRYVTVITVSYFDHKNEWILGIIGSISSYDLVIYVFVDPTNRIIKSFLLLP